MLGFVRATDKLPPSMYSITIRVADSLRRGMLAGGGSCRVRACQRLPHVFTMPRTCTMCGCLSRSSIPASFSAEVFSWTILIATSCTAAIVCCDFLG